jgi:hypothetical protein
MSKLIDSRLEERIRQEKDKHEANRIALINHLQSQLAYCNEHSMLLRARDIRAQLKVMEGQA